MKHQQHNPEEAMKQAVAEMRADQPTPENLLAAGERVWKSLDQRVAQGAQMPGIEGCTDIRKVLPEYHAGRLSESRVLLLEAHLHECAACRQQAETGKQTPVLQPWTQALPRMGAGGFRWAVAAVALVAAGLSVYFLQAKFFAGPTGMRASVISMDGALYRIGFSGEQPLHRGDEISEGDKVRTAGGARAMLRLRDGSLVEVNERAQLGVSMSRSNTTIHLDRGDIIVQAAKRKSGHLYVAARDCRVAVTGTVFAVRSGIKGSRISVIEGEVRVAEGGATRVLHPGDQLSTSAAVSAVPVRQEIAWSQDLDKHLALLAEFAKLETKLQAVQLPGLRYQSKLLPMLPANTVLYASIPNLGDAVQQVNRLFQQQLNESPVLNNWWQQAQSRKGGPDFNEIIDEIHSLSRYLGDEIVFSVGLDGRESSPLVIAQVQRPGLKEFVEQEYAKHADSSHPDSVQVFDEAGLTSAGAHHPGEKVFLLVRPDFVAAAVDVTALQRFNAALKQGGGGFAATPFGQRMNAAYQQGASLLFGANLQQMATEHETAYPRRNPQAFASTGLADVQYLVVERKDTGSAPVNHAELTFTGPRHGLASWLAAPAPIGGLDFISKDAGAAAAFVAKTPAQMLDDILSMAGQSDSNVQAEIANTESQLNIRLRQDLAETLGGEVSFALDGPILPTPSWKVVLEVYDPGRLQSTIQQLIADANQHIRENGRQLTTEQQAADGLTYYTIHLPGKTTTAEVDYTFVDGYMILGPSRAIVKNAISIHQNGNSLVRSADFLALLPQDQHADVSGLIYQNLAPLVGPVMNQLSQSQLQSLQQIAADTKPSVVCVYGEPNAVRVASNSRFFGLDLNTAALSALLKIAHPQGNFRE